MSVEDQKHGLPPIAYLRFAPATIRFLSIEPLLEDLGDFDLSGIDWAVVGGESGHGARPMEQAWVERILKLARERGVPFFFKQWGGVQKLKTGRVLLGRTFDEMPERIVAPFPPRTGARSVPTAAWDRSLWAPLGKQWSVSERDQRGRLRDSLLRLLWRSLGVEFA